MTVFFITFALGQLVWGPASDIFGRRRPLVVGVALFVASSIGCALAGDLHQLLVFRLIQGFGGASGMVIARAVVRDLHSGVEEARLLSLLMLVFSVSPICAPLIGNGVIALTSWRGVFWLVGGIAAACLVMIGLFVPETRSGARDGGNVRDVLRACGRLLRDRGFLGLTLVSSLAFSGFLVYLANSPFVLEHQYGMSPVEYSVAFSVNAAAFFAAMQFNAWLGARFGLARLIKPAVIGNAAIMLLALGATVVGASHFFLVAVLLFLGYAFLGVLLPVSSVLALEAHGAVAGTASSLMNALQLAIGSVMIAISGAFGDGSIFRLVAAIAGCSVLGLVVQLGVVRAPAR
jgi:DHA1 family bicyclomycin/chloramphenicol resistance-like MFS transporter